MMSHFYFLTNVVSNPRHPEVGAKAFHFRMYHGDLVGEQKKTRRPVVGEQGEPLRVVKNLYNIGDLFAPHPGSLVLSQDAWRALDEVGCRVDYGAVEFAKPFSYPYELGDFTYYTDATSVYDDTIAKRAADKYRVAPPQENYYEVRTYRSTDVCSNYSDCRVVTVGHDSDWWVDERNVHVSDIMLRDFGMVWDWGFLLSERVFEALEPFLNRPYFWWSRYPLQ